MDRSAYERLISASTVSLLAASNVAAVRKRRAAEHELDRYFENSAELLCIAGMDGYYRRNNPSFIEALGYSARELRSRPFIELVFEDDRHLTSTAADTLRRGQSVQSEPRRYVRRDGSVRWLDWMIRPDFERGLIYGSARDITGLKRLEEQHQALLRIATLVGSGAPPDDVFALTVAELQQVDAADTTVLLRYEADDTATYLAGIGRTGYELGARFPVGGRNVAAEVKRTGRPARMDYSDTTGEVAQRIASQGYFSALGAPVIVEGRVWGVMTSAWTTGRPPVDTEARRSEFTELVATAIANAENRSQLLQSRARIVATADETRRRIERDLHDGAQQRLVAMVMKLRGLDATVSPGSESLAVELDEIATGLDAAIEDLREIARGLHPAILSRNGLGAALRALARRSPVPVDLSVRIERRLPETIEVAAYYVAAEGLTNIARHAGASFLQLNAAIVDGNLQMLITDDGVGGAEPNAGSGLISMFDRVEALGGRVSLRSPRGGGTTLEFQFPLGGSAGASHNPSPPHAQLDRSKN